MIQSASKLDCLLIEGTCLYEVSVSPEEFRAHVEAVVRSGRKVVAPSWLAAPLGLDPRVEDGSFAFTFDDGYASVADHGPTVVGSKARTCQ